MLFTPKQTETTAGGRSPRPAREYRYRLAYRLSRQTGLFHQGGTDCEITVTVQPTPSGKVTFTILRSQLQVNGQAPVSAMDRLLASTGEVLYPLCIGFQPPAGNMHILNREVIRERWKALQGRLAREYSGTLAAALLRLLHDKMTTDAGLQAITERSPFLQLYLMLPALLDGGAPAGMAVWAGGHRLSFAPAGHLQVTKKGDEKTLQLDAPFVFSEAEKARYLSGLQEEGLRAAARVCEGHIRLQASTGPLYNMPLCAIRSCHLNIGHVFTLQEELSLTLLSQPA